MSRYDFEPFRREAAAPDLGILATRVGVSYRTISRWAKHGVPCYQADRAAVRIGSHPGNIWPDRWWIG